jgi:hypothetical protein
LSFDRLAKDAMPKKTKPGKSAAKQRVRASIDRVIAECDKVAAALIEMTRGTQHQDMPPLAIREIGTGDCEAVTRVWAVVSDDPQRPLTERQARDIVAAVRSLATPAPTSIAAE